MTAILITVGAIWLLGSFVMLVGLGLAAGKPTPKPETGGVLPKPELAGGQAGQGMLKRAA